MQRKEERFYTAGEFAKYFGIKKDTLLYYDKIKLFSPALVKKNGYRYYTTSQIAPFGTLLSLREMDVSLREIREYFADQSLERLSQMATAQMESIEAEQKRLKAVKRLFSEILRVKEEVDGAVLGQTLFQTLPAQRFLYSSQRMPGEEISDQQWWDAYAGFIEETQTSGAAFIGSVITRHNLERSQFGQVERLFMASDGPEGVLREGGLFAVYYHKGSYEQLLTVYPRLLSQINEAGYFVRGDAYEEYLVNELATPHEQECITKIVVRVEKEG